MKRLFVGVALAGLVAAAEPPAAPRRWVPYSPALAELGRELGLEKAVVGVTRWTRRPPGDRTPVVGDAVSVDLEAMMAARPEVVVRQGGGTDGFDALGRLAPHIRIETIRLERLADIPAAARRLLEVIGGPADASAIRDFELVLKATTAAPAIRPRTLFLLGGDRPLAAGPDTYVGDMIEHVGGINAGADLPGRGAWRAADVEGVATARPDLLVCHDDGLAAAEHAAQWWRRRLAGIAKAAPQTIAVSEPEWRLPSLGVARLLPRLREAVLAAAAPTRAPDPETRDPRPPDAGVGRTPSPAPPASASP